MQMWKVTAVKVLLPLLLLHLHIATGEQEMQLNDRPIIGVLAQKFSDPFLNRTSFIDASYVKYLEMAGARVVPLFTNMTAEELKEMFAKINGVLFPGGDADLMSSPYKTNAQLLFNLARDEYDNGGYFPIWGTCLGFQVFSVIVAKSDKVMTPSTETYDKSLNLNFTGKQSRLFADASDAVLNTFTAKYVTYNAHYNCVSIETYHNSNELQTFLLPITTSVDSIGMEFISTYEARKYPFYATQWHPEMNVFEFARNEGLGTNIKHSQDAIIGSQYLANFFVKECRKSGHRFSSREEESKILMYNYQPVYTSPLGLFSEQTYLF